MAYAEKRGKGPAPWRVRYNVHGEWLTKSGFETKEEALNWGRDQESDARRGVHYDPRSGEITLQAWIEDHWWPAQDLAIKSRTNYWSVISNHILPEFADRPLNSIVSPNEINVWERRVTKEAGPEAAKAARARLITILGDAVADRRIPTNPALRARKRGRKRKVADRQQEKVVVTPLQVLLHAERCALLSGWDGDFVKMVTIAYTGMRWGETIGLEPQYVRLDAIRVDWQLVEDGGKFYKTPPKDDSMRTIDLPPFLSDLLSRQKQTMAGQTCSHVVWEPREDAEEGEEPCPGGVAYLWLGERGGHPRNSNYIRRTFDPACEGWYPKDAGRKGPAKPVLVDMAAGWPGRPIRHAWPAAVPGEPFTPPGGFRSGRPALDLEQVWPASWLPVAPGLTPHGLRHSHQVWMDEDGTPEVLMHERLGHDMEGMKRVYRHVSPAMRAALRGALQRRWRAALEERAALDPHSPVALLDELLRPLRRRPGRPSPKSLPTSTKAAPRVVPGSGL